MLMVIEGSLMGSLMSIQHPVASMQTSTDCTLARTVVLKSRYIEDSEYISPEDLEPSANMSGS